MPISLYALAAAAFAIGMAEFVVVGILPAIATDMQIDIPTAGQLVSLYALGVAIAAPIITPLTSRIDRRLLACGLMVLFVAANWLAWQAQSYPMLLVGRVLAGVVQGVFYSMATVVAANSVPKEKSGAAIGIMFTGLTVALVAGVPLGTFLTDLFDWRAAFLFITVLGALSIIALWVFLPKKVERPEPASLIEQLSIVTVPKMLLVFLITGIGYGGAFIAYTYLSEILQKVTGFSVSGVGTVLIFYGIAVTLGNTFFARLADKRGAIAALLWILGLLIFAMAVLSLVAVNKVLMVPVVMLWGAVAFGSIPVLQLYVVQQAEIHAPKSVDASSSINIGAFNGGIAAGAWIGGIVVEHFGLMATGPAAAIVVGVSILLTLVSGAWDKKHAKSLAAAA
ncbi:MFS transporter [Salinicola rhizosphaerae]|uniref:MFS transporter n=1 Tax=Salinicola rhizosphaerae TaxID=1443141 RepID=A0ABQ3DZT9_9GAMM|nr:MFS transporter [Salinicola rhizosphaerae]GHB18716.1 MFS transporter [Salinicola rhizosphaerae]